MTQPGHIATDTPPKNILKGRKSMASRKWSWIMSRKWISVTYMEWAALDAPADIESYCKTSIAMYVIAQ